MKISIELDTVLTPDEQNQLRSKLGGNAKSLESLALAATADLADTLLNRRAPSRLGDVDQRRLLHLTLNAFPKGLPSERQIQDLFYVTRSRASSMLRNLAARESALLSLHFKRSTIAVFATRKDGEEGTYDVTLSSRYLAEWLMQVAEQAAVGLQPMRKIKDANERYAIPKDTYNAICRYLGLDPANPK